MQYRLSLSLCLLCLQVVAQSPTDAGKVYSPRHADILWDTFGVPHIYGKDISSMYYAFGWSQMHNHGNLILQLYGIARGRAAEYWGSAYKDGAKIITQFRIPALAAESYQQQEPEMKEYLDAFVAGINDYAAAWPQHIGPALKQVLPITGQDVLAHGFHVFFLEFLAAGDMGNPNILKPGSNAYAIGKSRSATRNALLLANPHLPWSSFYTFMEAHLQAPGFNAYGATLIGMPVLTIAFNKHLGWTHTVNTIDAVDTYAYPLKDGGYVKDSVIMPFRYDTLLLQVLQPDCIIKTDTTLLAYAGNEPVLATKDNKAYTMKIAGMNHTRFFFEWHLMAQAQNYREFGLALRRMQLPLFNVIYADKAGNVGYFFGGNVPSRDTGNWDYWHGVVDGSTSKNNWDTTLGYNEMPKLFNPPTGFIQNANDPPWYCTYPPILSPGDFPSYISPVGMEFRPQRAINMIKNNFAVTLDDLQQYKFNTGLEVADRFLDTLLAAVQQYPEPAALAAADVLRRWDRKTDSSSTGALLYIYWFSKLSLTMFNVPWDPSNPVETPAGLSDKPMAVKLLSAAAREVYQSFGTLEIPWGLLFRFRGGTYDFAGNGGPAAAGIYRTIEYGQDPDGRMRAVYGDSYMALVEFGRKIKARVLLSYGNASQPDSKHIGDQLYLMSQKKTRTPWLEKQEILQHLEKRETVGH